MPNNSLGRRPVRRGAWGKVLVPVPAFLMGAAVMVGTPAPPAGAAPTPAVDWSSVPVQAAPWAVQSLFIDGISCLSTTDCLASGFDEVANPAASTYPPKVAPDLYHPLVWHWDGQAWRFEMVGPGGSVAWGANSCPNAGDCWMVGTKIEGKLGNQSAALVEHLAGGPWSAVGVPSPSGVALNGVACRSASSCVAVGSRQTASDAAHALGYLWDGKSWSAMTAPAPKGALWSVLDSVSCPTATKCLAVGDAENGAKGPGYFFAEVLNGSSWSLSAMPNPDKFNMGNESALSISCPTATQCLAIGSALAYTGGQLGADFPGGVAYSWSGSSWARLAPPRLQTPGYPSGPAYVLNGVSCVATNDCWVAMEPPPPESPVSSPLSLGRWEGGQMSSAPVSLDAYLAGISCVKSNASTWCIGLGQKPGKTNTARPVLISGHFSVASPGGTGQVARSSR